MLLCSLALTPLDVLGMQERAEMFLEIHGNAHVRAATSEWVAATAHQLVKVVCYVLRVGRVLHQQHITSMGPIAS